MEHLKINERLLEQYREKKMNAWRLFCSRPDMTNMPEQRGTTRSLLITGAYIFLIRSSRALRSKCRVSPAWLMSKTPVIQAKEWSKITTKHKEVNYVSSWSTQVWDDWLKNGTPYHESGTFVTPFNFEQSMNRWTINFEKPWMWCKTYVAQFNFQWKFSILPTWGYRWRHFILKPVVYLCAVCKYIRKVIWSRRM